MKKPEPNEQQTPRLTAEQIEHNRHYAPVEAARRSEASGYEWEHERAGIHSYRHNQTSGWLHIDSQGQFFDRHAQPISRETALEHARYTRHSHAHSVGENALRERSPRPVQQHPVSVGEATDLHPADLRC